MTLLRAIPVLLVLMGVGCASPRPPELLRVGDMGRRLPTAVAALGQEGLLPDCAAYAGLLNHAAEAESVVASWFDVVSHLDRCEIGTVRYYSGPDTEDGIASRLTAVAEAGPPLCGAQARGVLSRVRAANRRIAQWIPLGVDVCGQKELSQDAYASSERARQATVAIRCQLNRDFPELAKDGCR